MNWKKVKLGELCVIEKGNIGITKAVPGEYPLVVLGEERKSHNEYQFDDEAVVIPLVSSTGHGHKSLKRIFFQKGKFAVGSILCAVIPKDKSALSAEFLYRYLDFNKERELVSRMKGMANVSLPIKEIASIEIPLPPLETQRQIIERFQRLETSSQLLTNELDCQLDIVRQLRQAFLREAMQGRLVAQDAADEPATALLQKIKAEKEKLISEKKLRRDNPIPSIKPSEVPFEIPDNWAWCRLGTLSYLSEAGKSHKCEERRVLNGEWGIIKVSAISWDSFLEDENKFFSKETPLDTSAKVNEGDFLISRANTYELVGKSVVVKRCAKNLLLSDKTIRYKFSESVNSEYLNVCNNSPFARQYYASIATGTSPSMKNITREQMDSLIIPLPPLAEQRRIVAKLETLFAFCDELEAGIRAGQAHTESLLQVALKEALQA